MLTVGTRVRALENVYEPGKISAWEAKETAPIPVGTLGTVIRVAEFHTSYPYDVVFDGLNASIGSYPMSADEIEAIA